MGSLEQKILTIIYSWGIWLLWWLANMLYKQIKWEKFNLTQRVSSLALAFLVAWLVGELIPNDMMFKDWLLWVAWATSYAIMWLIETYWAKFIVSKTPIKGIEVIDMNKETKDLEPNEK